MLDIPNFIVYDEMYEIKSWLTSALIGGSTTWFTVQDASDMVAYETLRFHKTSDGSFEDRVILTVDKFNNRIQVEYPPTYGYKAGEDSVTMRKYYVPSDKIVFFASSVDGEKIADYKEAPFGLERTYGLATDSKDEWDPEGIFIRTRNKGLPVLYHRDAVYQLTVKTLAATTQTSTTTTSSSSTTTTTA